MSHPLNSSSAIPLSVIPAFLSLLVAAGTFAHSQQTPPVIKTESDLVLVRVVVRDNQGKQITGLKKEDFKLYDRGKEQHITQFDEVAADSPVSTAKPATAQDSQSPTPSNSPTPSRLVAFYFDDLNAPADSLMRSRDAADKFIATHLETTDKVAIFSSDKLLTDFTSDPTKIHQALAQLNGSTHARQSVHPCPDLSEYQAEQLVRSDDYQHDSAWQLAGDEIKQCSGTSDPTASLTLFQIRQIKSMAQDLLNQSQASTRANLDQLEQVTRYMTHLPGRRTLLLVSPGFLTGQDQFRLDRIIDQALHAQVVINALDPKGLALLMRNQDASRRPIANTVRSMNDADTLDRQQAFASGDVLTELAQGTGGQLFHNDNDLGAGFDILAGHPDEYTLAFSPIDLKRDGKFHDLKVALVNQPKGTTVSARKGYFASQETAAAPSPAIIIPSVPAASSTPNSQASPQGQQIEDSLRQAILANTDSKDLPIQLEVKQSATEISILIHLDASAIPFRKDGDHSVDTVTFAAAVFDSNDKVGTIKQRSAKLNVTPEQLASLIANGINLPFTFPLEAGAHRVRAVVIESEQHRVGSLSQTVGAN